MSQRPEISMEEQERIATVLVSILKLLRRADPKLEDCLLCTNHSGDDILVSLPTCGHVLGIRCLVGYLSSHGTTCPICSRDCKYEDTWDAGFLPKTAPPSPATTSQVPGSKSSSLQAAEDAFNQTIDRVNRFLGTKPDETQTNPSPLWNPPKYLPMVRSLSPALPASDIRPVHSREPELTIGSSKLWSSTKVNENTAISREPQTDNFTREESPAKSVDSSSQLSATSSESSVPSVKEAVDSLQPPPPARHAGISYMVQRARVIVDNPSVSSLSKPMGFGTSPGSTSTSQNSARGGGFMSFFSRKPPAQPRPSLEELQQKAHELMQDETPSPPPTAETAPEEMIKLGQELFRMAADAKTERDE